MQEKLPLIRSGDTVARWVPNHLLTDVAAPIRPKIDVSRM
jgi:hypothetical protein